MKFSLLSIIGFTLLRFSSSGFGQETGNEDYIHITYSAISWDSSINGKLFVQQNGEYIPFNIYKTGRTLERIYVGPNPMLFYGKFKNAEGRTEYRPAAQAMIQPETNQALLIFTKNHNNNEPTDEGYKVITLDDSKSAFPRGSYRFVNWSGGNIAGKLDGEIFVLAPQAEKTIQPEKDSKSTIPIQLVELKDDDNSKIYSANWYFQPNTRKLVILMPVQQRGKKKVVVKVIADYMPPAS